MEPAAWKGRAFLHPETLRDGACGEVPHDDFERDDLDLADQLLAHVHAADEVVRDADGSQPLHEEFRQAVVQDALALDRRFLLRVEGGRVVLEVLDEGSGLRAFVQDLRLAFVNLLATCHDRSFRTHRQTILPACALAFADRTRPARLAMPLAEMRLTRKDARGAPLARRGVSNHMPRTRSLNANLLTTGPP
jgi:hypothetical protein